jgi:leucine dehydrogenase
MQRLEIDGFDEVYRLDCGGAIAFVALHAVIEGRTFGGIRIRHYEAEADALEDALRLARAMSRKVAMAGIRAGGAKTVLVEPRGRRAEAVRALGEFIESLGGRYHCGPDLGFTADDDTALRGVTGHVACGILGDVTARGVLSAMRAVCEPRSAAVQGLGSVGRPLARELERAGVRVTGTDLRDVPGVDTVAPEEIYDVEADVFSPCAVGGSLDAVTVERLRCSVVCGGANNPCATAHDADRLHERGIIYVPDFLASAGAVIDGGSKAMGEAHLVEERLSGMAGRVRDVMERARREDLPPWRVAVREADRRIARLRNR